MSTYGLQIVNPSGTLVLSSDAFGLYYAGKATYVADVVQGDMNQSTNGSSGYGAGNFYISYKTYTFSSSAACAFAVAVDSSTVTAIVQIVFASGVYTITVAKSSGAAGSHGFKTQNAAEVYAFIRAGSVSGAYGLALYDSAGTLAWDLTRLPLFMREAVNFSAGTTTSVAYTGTYTKMGVFGPIMSHVDTQVLISAPTGTYNVDGIFAGFQVSGSNLKRVSDKYRDGPTVVVGAGNVPVTSDSRAPTIAYLFEATGL